MKKFVLIMLTLIMLLSGCTKAEEVAVETPAPTPEPTEEPISNTRPIAIMIDNDNNDARPHAGIEDAQFIYEMYVEGSATRMMAIYKDANTEKIGPVRSSRHYFLDYALEHDATYVHYGWSPQATRDIKSLGVNNINGVSDGGGIFWRERKFKGDWHSAYTSIENIKTFATETKKYRNITEVLKPFNKNKEDVQIAGDTLTKITLPYAGFYNASYEYDESTNTYKRYINGAGHITQADFHIAPKNIIIQKARNYTISGDTSGRQNIETTGSGEGYFITGGKIAKINWSKPDRKAKTTYTFLSGEEISLNPGQTWIQIVPPSMQIELEPAPAVQ